MSSSKTAERIKSLDITRGVAVMGILSVNIVGLAMIKMAYFYPPAFGFDGMADRLMWLANFILIDGKLRALFSIMFGASTLLVIERAIAAGRSPARTHYARMVVLIGIGFLHWLLFWWGDILTHYAAVGALAFLFHRLKARTLLIIAAGLLLFHAGGSLIFSTQPIATLERVEAGTATAEDLKRVEQGRARMKPDAAALAAEDAGHASVPAHVRHMLATEGPVAPLDLGPLWFETLGLMLLGMGLFKTGFLTGALEPRTYRRVALATVPPGLALFGLAAWYSISHDYAGPYHMAAYGGFTPILRPIVAVGYAALIILACRRGQASGWWATHLAAVGRTAFSNYLLPTLVGTLLFFGFGLDLYLKLSRFEAWLLVPPMWAAMLVWSKWWLDRFHYGPLEWVWRSLARWQRQPMRKGVGE